MSGQNLETQEMCEEGEGVKDGLKKFKFNKTKKAAAMFLKIIVSEDKIVIDEEFEDVTTEELREELPESQPRYIVYSYVHHTKDDRISYPLIFIYYHPSGCNPNQVMRYAGCKNKMDKMSGASYSLELVDRENLTDEWLISSAKLK